jgi:hypothetical protein
MEWIFEHLQALFFIAIAVVAILQRLKKSGQEESTPRSQVAPEEEERTRRIQEEIRRRIMERRGPAPARQPAEERRPFPPAPPMIEEVRPLRVEPPSLVEISDGVDDSAEYRRQQDLIERARVAEAARRSRAAIAGPAPAAVAGAEHSEQLIPGLHDRSGLRRAIVLREILGPPVGLR